MQLPTLTILAAAAAMALPSLAEAQQKKRGPSDPILAKYDKDGDGVLSKAERRAWRADRRAKALAKYDTNKNGRLDVGERDRMMIDRANAMLGRLDGDKSGSLSRREVGKARGLRFRMLRRGFDRIDADGDGELTRGELIRMQRFMAHKRRQRGKRGGPPGGKGHRRGPRGDAI